MGVRRAKSKQIRCNFKMCAGPLQRLWVDPHFFPRTLEKINTLPQDVTQEIQRLHVGPRTHPQRPTSPSEAVCRLLYKIYRLWL